MSNLITSARPYAKAAYAIAQEQNNFAAWSQLLDMAAMVIQDPAMQTCLQSPKFSATQLGETLVKICKVALFPQGENFLKLLSARRRLKLLPDIAALFAAFRAEQEKMMMVNVISAKPLTDSEKEKIIVKLNKKLQRDVKLQCEVDETMVGGLIIQADDLVIDASVRGKLRRLSHVLLS